MLLQRKKAKKRASTGGSVAGGDAAASSLVFELADLKRTVYTFSDEQKPRLRQMLLAQCQAARAKHRHMTSDHLAGGKYDPGSSLCTPLIKRLLAKCDRTNDPAETVQGMKDRIDTNFKNLGALATQGLTMARYNNAFGTGGSFLQMDEVYRAAAYRVAKRMLPVDRQRAKEAAAKQAAAEEEETRKSAREREKRAVEKAAKKMLWGLQEGAGEVVSWRWYDQRQQLR